MAALYTILFVALFWLSGARNPVALLVIIAVSLPTGLYAAAKIRKASEYSIKYIEDGRSVVLRRFVMLSKTGEVPSNKAERDEYLLYLDKLEQSSQRAAKQAPLMIVIMLLCGVTLSSHGRISLFTILSAMMVGVFTYFYIQVRITVARIPMLKKRLESYRPSTKVQANVPETARSIAGQYPILYVYAMAKALILVLAAVIKKQPLFVAINLTAHHSSSYLLWTSILNIVTILYFALPIYIAVSRSISGVLRALAALLSLLLIGLLSAALRPDYWGVALELAQIGFTLLMLVILAKGAAKVRD